MAGPVGGEAARSKGKGKSQDGDGGSAAGPVGGASTPPRGAAERRTLPEGARRSLAQHLVGQLSGGSSEDADIGVPRANTVGILVLVVALLTVLKSLIMPVRVGR